MAFNSHIRQISMTIFLHFHIKNQTHYFDIVMPIELNRKDAFCFINYRLKEVLLFHSKSDDMNDKVRVRIRVRVIHEFILEILNDYRIYLMLKLSAAWSFHLISTRWRPCALTDSINRLKMKSVKQIAQMSLVLKQGFLLEF